MDEIVHEFLVESHECLDRLDRDLVLLEQRPGAQDLLASIFRTIHSIKGTSGFLAFDRLGTLTHAGEGLLAGLRDGRVPMTPATADALLRMVDVVRELLSAIEADGTEGDVEVDGAVAQLEGLLEARRARETEATGAARTAAPERHEVSETSVRVDVHVLDELVELVEELGLTRDQLVRAAGACPPGWDLPVIAQRLDVLVDALRSGVVRTRRVPAGHLWSHLPRVVRDLGVRSGKLVRVVLDGTDTELDRGSLESVKDALTHLVRNAVDHGLETPELRLAAGKPAEGTVTLRACHEDGQVVLAVSDDGVGIDPARVVAAARRAGTVTEGRLDGLSPAEVMELVLLPGVTTAASVTHLSGRGIGMDVVRANVEHLGGTVEIDSHVGRGTTCRLRIPVVAGFVGAVAPA
jgi:two-component system chemotaxis sensor kinase CheA